MEAPGGGKPSGPSPTDSGSAPPSPPWSPTPHATTETYDFIDTFIASNTDGPEGSGTIEDPFIARTPTALINKKEVIRLPLAKTFDTYFAPTNQTSNRIAIGANHWSRSVPPSQEVPGEQQEFFRKAEKPSYPEFNTLLRSHRGTAPEADIASGVLAAIGDRETPASLSPDLQRVIGPLAHSLANAEQIRFPLATLDTLMSMDLVMGGKTDFQHLLTRSYGSRHTAPVDAAFPLAHIRSETQGEAIRDRGVGPVPENDVSRKHRNLVRQWVAMEREKGRLNLRSRRDFADERQWGAHVRQQVNSRLSERLQAGHARLQSQFQDTGSWLDDLTPEELDTLEIPLNRSASPFGTLPSSPAPDLPVGAIRRSTSPPRLHSSSSSSSTLRESHSGLEAPSPVQSREAVLDSKSEIGPAVPTAPPPGVNTSPDRPTTPPPPERRATSLLSFGAKANERGESLRSVALTSNVEKPSEDASKRQRVPLRGRGSSTANLLRPVPRHPASSLPPVDAPGHPTSLASSPTDRPVVDLAVDHGRKTGAETGQDARIQESRQKFSSGRGGSFKPFRGRGRGGGPQGPGGTGSNIT